jgi:dihydrofolate reductase
VSAALLGSIWILPACGRHQPPDRIFHDQLGAFFVGAGWQSEPVTTTQYYTATSIDGFIADQHNSLNWLFEVESKGADQFRGFFAGVGAFAMGATTYEWVLANEKLLDQPQSWHEWYGDTPCWVFTHRDLPPVPGADITFVSGDARPVHEAMVSAAQSKNVWLVGGGELVGAFADQGLLDEIILGVAPVTLGAGAPLLPRRLTSSQLTLSTVERADQFVYLTYTVRRPAAG